MKKPHALLIKFPGTNCDEETERALVEAGFEVRLRLIADLIPSEVSSTQLIVMSGGFSYGDYVMAGRLAELVLEQRVGTALQDFYADGGHLLGICNGFQILARIGILPEVSLIQNVSGRFVCRWSELDVASGDNAFLQGLPAQIELPVAHAEGRLVAASPEGASSLVEKGLVVLRYGENFNGSMEQIAGLQDEDGRVLGLMPHPERFLS
ncbi:MAG: phosphoribosylformylglycinamidine synthase I, partial [Verrucomicrobiota bacterium]